MAMRLPEVKLTSASPLPTSGFERTSTVAGPFAGYPSGSNEIKPT